MLAIMAMLGICCLPRQAVAAEAEYPYAAKPCIWAPYAASGSGTGWCADYDFGDTPNDTSSANVISPYGYYYRNCTDYTAWKVSTRGVDPTQYKGLGNAKDWAANASARGLRVDNVPIVGAVGVSARGSYGHTAYVEAVNPGGYAEGTIEVSQYNYAGDGNYSHVFGTPALLGLTQFVHFEAYTAPSAPEPAPAVPLVAATMAAPPVTPEPPAPAATEGQTAALAAQDVLPDDEPTLPNESTDAAANPPPEETTEPPPEAQTADAARPVLAPEPWHQSETSPPLSAPALTRSAQNIHDAPHLTPTAAHTPSFASWPLIGLASTVLVGESLGRRSARNAVGGLTTK